MSALSWKLFFASLAVGAIIGARGMRDLNDGSETSVSERSARTLSWTSNCRPGVTPIYGGGGGTNRYNFNSGTNVYIKSITVKSGEVTDSVKAVLTNGRHSKTFGGRGGNKTQTFNFEFGEYEYVRKIVLYRTMLEGARVHLSGGLKIITNKKKASFGPCETISVKVKFRDEDRVKLYGITGRYGYWLDSIGFRYISYCGDKGVVEV